jgi:hypothetical protein
MRETLVSLGLGIVLVGCASPQAKRSVTINLEKAAAHYALGWAPEPNPQNLQMNSENIGVASSVPAQPSNTLKVEDNPAQRREVERTILEVKSQARAQIENKLRAAYLREIEIDIPDLELQLESLRQTETDAWLNNIDSAFWEYARKRGPLLARYNLYSSLPSRSDKRMERLGVFDDRDKIAAELLAQIKALDAEYDAKKKAELAQLNAKAKERSRRLWEDIEARRRDAMERAAEQAAKQVIIDLEGVESVLELAPDITSPATPQVLANGAVSATPDVSPAQQVKRLPLREQALLDAKIWAAQSNYNLVFTSGAPDKTEEFLAWKAKLTGR